MDVGTILSVAQTLLAALDCDPLKRICSTAGYKSQLDQLRATVVRIKAVLKDAESKQELSEQEQLYVEELKDAVYEADDLFDEFVTLAERNELSKGIKVRVFSLFTKFGTAYNMSQGVKRIKNRLDAIASDKRFELSIDPKPIKNRRLETCSYVYEADIIGRDADLEKIVFTLLNSSNVQQDVSFLSIVGIGGLGKTALAQLVYNDARVTTAFPLRLWTCVADEDQELLDIKGVLGKILSSATGHTINDGYTMDSLQIKLRKILADKKFLLVLDDVWTEDPGSWHNLTHFLMGGQRGSWIVVTTCSHETVRIIRDGFVHFLPYLSKENSWCLFRKVAFGSHLSDVPEDFVKIGEDILEECANVPLAIRVVGSLLYGQDTQKWLSIQKMGLANIKQSQNSIMSILKLSYHKLEFPLKSCFSYCAIFPKDYVIPKDTLISLWIAHGYIPLYGPQSPEVLGEEYFSILLQRCFFQNVRKDEFGDIVSCKLHDLMHDLAQQVVGKEICTAKTMNGDVDKKVRHLSRISTANFSFTNKTHIRSYLDANGEWRHYTRLMFRMDQVCADSLIGNWKYLRVLDLRRFKIKSLTCSIGKLIHLRYLDLSFNECLEVLPSSITKLCNLLTLKLRECLELKELPNDMRKLVKLRTLDLYLCTRLKYMPRGMGKLSCLQNLTRFVVGGTGSSKKEVFDGLKDLKDLSELRGSLTIRIPFRKTIASSCKINNGGIEGGCLGNKEHLTRVEFNFDVTSNKEGVERSRVEYDEAVMEELQPLNSKLKSLVVYGYCGVRIPSWPRDDNTAIFLPNLFRMEFSGCLNLEYLGKIRLPQLKILRIVDCKNLIAVLECPALVNLKLENFNERLKIIPISGSSSDDTGPKLVNITIDNVSWLNSLPMNPFHDGAKLSIMEDNQVESLGEAIEGFRSCSSSLEYLKISRCSNLKKVVCEGIEHLSTLQSLEICFCNSLSLSEEVEKVSLCQSLRTLRLKRLPHLLQVPNWIQYLTSLQTLHIDNCKRVKSMPSWMSKLTSLIDLQVTRCSKRLDIRCQGPTGEDWPHIQHIPRIFITDGYISDLH